MVTLRTSGSNLAHDGVDPLFVSVLCLLLRRLIEAADIHIKQPAIRHLAVVQRPAKAVTDLSHLGFSDVDLVVPLDEDRECVVLPKWCRNELRVGHRFLLDVGPNDSGDLFTLLGVKQEAKRASLAITASKIAGHGWWLHPW